MIKFIYILERFEEAITINDETVLPVVSTCNNIEAGQKYHLIIGILDVLLVKYRLQYINMLNPFIKFDKS